MKNKLSILLTLILTLILCVCGLFACGDTSGGGNSSGNGESGSGENNQQQEVDWNLVYTVEGGEITGLTIYGKTLTELVIPNAINGANITSIGSSAFKDRTSLTSVTIQSNIQSIGELAFYNCVSLTSIIIPNSVYSIGSSAFSGCASLTSIEIPNSVQSMGQNSFFYCTALTQVDYLGTIDSWAQIEFKSSSANPLYNGADLYLNGVKQSETTISAQSINKYAFYNCTSLTRVTIGEGVQNIGEKAFYNCDSLVNVLIGNNVQYIGSSAFYNCSSLLSATIGSGVQIIEDEAFDFCYKLVEVINKSPNITVNKEDYLNGYVGYYALKVFNSGDTYENKFTNDNGYIIYNEGTEKVLCGYIGEETALTLPSYITKINRYAFRDCTSLTILTMGNSLKGIGSSAFYNCTALEKVNYLGSIDSWAQISFKDYNANPLCNGVDLYINNVKQTEITINPQTINKYAFYNCKSLTSVIIGESVQSIGDWAFSDCKSLTGVIIGESVQSIGYDSFYNCSALKSVTIGSSVQSIGFSAFEDCTALEKVNYLGSIDSWAQISFEDYYSNPLCNGADLYINNVKQTEITINAQTIKEKAFYGCKSLTSVIIGSGVESIGEEAFKKSTSLTSITIGSGVESIDKNVFEDCVALENIYFSDISTWYRTTSKSNWQNKTSGIETSVNVSSTNATNFTSFYKSCYWYKI